MRIITSPLHELTLLGNICIALIVGGFSISLFFDPLRDHRIFSASIGFISLLALFLPRIFYYLTKKYNLLTKRILAHIELLVTLILVMNALGGLGFHHQFQYYDMVEHFFGGWSTAIVASLLFGSVMHYHHQWNLRTITRKSIMVTVILLLLWELWEFVGDHAFGTYMLGQSTEKYDTLYDIVIGLLAMIPFSYYNGRYMKHMFP